MLRKNVSFIIYIYLWNLLLYAFIYYNDKCASNALLEDFTALTNITTTISSVRLFHKFKNAL